MAKGGKKKDEDGEVSDQQDFSSLKIAMMSKRSEYGQGGRRLREGESRAVHSGDPVDHHMGRSQMAPINSRAEPRQFLSVGLGSIFQDWSWIDPRELEPSLGRRR